MKVTLDIIQGVVNLFIISIIVLMIFGYKEYRQVVNTFNLENTIRHTQLDVDYTKLEDVSNVFLESIIATEDKRFYNHGAIEIRSIARATVVNILNGEFIQGGSTITQQLAKNIFLTNDKNLMRKIKEMFISFELERKYTKNEILELYINNIYYGDGYTGIGEASKGYFNKTPKELTYDESTLLAGIPQAPSLYALSTGYEYAKERQESVIKALQNVKDKDTTFNLEGFLVEIMEEVVNSCNYYVEKCA